MGYDIIGDIHGYVIPLRALLKKLGYGEENGYYRHPEGRKVIFLGDFIDRGPHIRETLHLVRAMTDNGTAEAIMGNHEYNAICFHYEKQDNSGYLRKHNEKNTAQHQPTLTQFAAYGQEWNEWIRWFNGLPMFVEKEGFRAVHACWDSNLIAHLKSKAGGSILPMELIYGSQEAGTMNYEAIERTLKGKEFKLPDGLFFRDKDGHKRTETRTRWWMDAEQMEYNQYFMQEVPELAGKKISQGEIADNNPYSENDIPVFIGHYWLEGTPELQRANVACLDYSVANGGKLVAYRFNGEKELKGDLLIY